MRLRSHRAVRIVVVTVVSLAAASALVAAPAGSAVRRVHPRDRPVPPAVNAARGASAPLPSAAADQAFAAAQYFLAHYELPGGRVVRRDQGGDTVSEGEAYAMLLSVAAGDRPRFDSAWAWTRSHLLQSSGLLAWHWANGRITGSEPAADADVDAAYALELAARRFGERADLQSARAMAAAILSDETVAAPSGRVLVGGPWAVGPPTYANPSYAAPAELAALGGLADPQGFAALAEGTRALVAGVLAVDRLPPDWVQLATGPPLAVTPPGLGPVDRYGFDAARLPVRWAASCDDTDRRTVAALWPPLERAARQDRATVNLAVVGHGSADAVRSPVGLVAAAAAGWAAGHTGAAVRLLDRAEARNRVRPTYYASAWVALGRVLLETARLGTCGGR